MRATETGGATKLSLSSRVGQRTRYNVCRYGTFEVCKGEGEGGRKGEKERGERGWEEKWRGRREGRKRERERKVMR